MRKLREIFRNRPKIEDQDPPKHKGDFWIILPEDEEGTEEAWNRLQREMPEVYYLFSNVSIYNGVKWTKVLSIHPDHFKVAISNNWVKITDLRGVDL